MYAIIDCMLLADNDNSGNCGETTTGNFPVDEENHSSEEELISHLFESYLAEIIHVRFNTTEALNISHRAPHIEFLTPPPEL